MNLENNLVAKMLNLDVVKKLIENCSPDEVVILCPQWSINKPQYLRQDSSDNESEQFDLDELEDELHVTLLVTDYNDLVADVHGLYLND